MAIAGLYREDIRLKLELKLTKRSQRVGEYEL